MTDNEQLEVPPEWKLNGGETQALTEAINDRLLSLRRVNQWVSLTNALESESDGPQLDLLKEISPTLREMAASSPWPKRGAQLVHSYVFGRGVNFSNVDKPARVREIMNDPHNRATMFSVSAYETANLALFTDGNYFVIRETEGAQAKFIVVPLSQITSSMTDPDDASSLWYLKRTWSANGKEQERWYPLARYKNRAKGKLLKTIEDVPVSTTGVMYHHAAKRQSGWRWGIPESLAGMVWVEAYAAYLRDNTTLVRALSKIAWKITNTTPGGAGSAAAVVRDGGDQVGGVASMASGNQLQGVGVPSASVNMGNGQPIIAAAAASYGVPTTALLSSTGENGGGYGAEATLDEPTVKGMGAIQDSWGLLFQEILVDLGAKDAYAEFPAIQADPAWKQITSINQAAQIGLLHRDEARLAVLDIADVTKLHDNLPEADGFNKWSDPTAPKAGVNDPLSRQGNTGSVPGGQDQDTPEHDENELE